MPLGEMAALCHRYGAELAVDSIQAAGVVPLDATALGIDYLAGGAHKWLLGIEGCGYLYVRPELLPNLRPVTAGWTSHEGGLGFLTEGAGHLRYDRPLLKSARYLESGSSSVAGFAALLAGMHPIVELGVSQVFGHVAAYLDELEPQLVLRGFSSLRSSDPAGRSGILSVEVPKGLGLADLSAAMRERGVQLTTPDGLLRFAPHFPNSLDEVPQVLDALDESIERLRVQ
jgi:selenocysteine lyase/cysteine desulfurase